MTAALESYTVAAENGHMYAQHEISKMYALGEVAARDLPRALEYAATNSERAFAVGDVMHDALTAHLNETAETDALSAIRYMAAAEAGMNVAAINVAQMQADHLQPAPRAQVPLPQIANANGGAEGDRNGVGGNPAGIGGSGGVGIGAGIGDVEVNVEPDGALDNEAMGGGYDGDDGDDVEVVDEADVDAEAEAGAGAGMRGGGGGGDVGDEGGGDGDTGQALHGNTANPANGVAAAAAAKAKKADWQASSRARIAQRYWRLAAAASPEAMVQLGHLYWYGIADELEVNRTKAEECYLSAAQNQDPEGLYIQGYMWISSLGSFAKNASYVARREHAVLSWANCSAAVPCWISLLILPYFDVVDAVVPPWLGDAVAWAAGTVASELSDIVAKASAVIATKAETAFDTAVIWIFGDDAAAADAAAGGVGGANGASDGGKGNADDAATTSGADGDTAGIPPPPPPPPPSDSEQTLDADASNIVDAAAPDTGHSSDAPTGTAGGDG